MHPLSPMSPFAKLMSRFGWIRLSSYGLALSMDGRLVPAGSGAQLSLESWSPLPAASLDLAAAFDPALGAKKPVPQPRALPPALPRAIAPATAKATGPRPPLAASLPSCDDTRIDEAEPTRLETQTASKDQTALQEEMSEEEEWAWQAAVAKAKAADEGSDESTQCDTLIADDAEPESDEEIGFADTAPLRPSQSDGEQTEVAAKPREETEDWELLVKAALERAQSEDATSTAEVSAFDDTKIEAGPQGEGPDFAAAQVESSAVAANDDLPAESVTSINAIKLRPLAAAAKQSQADDDEWSAMRTQIDANEREESARKLRAMREIRRLQGRTPHQDFIPRGAGSPPPRRRLGAGTSPAPTAFAKGSAQPLATLRSSAKSSDTSGGDDTRVDLPRATERLSR